MTVGVGDARGWGVVLSSSSSSSGGTTAAGGVGGRSETFPRLDCPLGFRGRIDPAQAEARFFFFCFFSLRLFLPDVDSLVSPTDSEPCSEDDPTDTALVIESSEQAL